MVRKEIIREIRNVLKVKHDVSKCVECISTIIREKFKASNVFIIEVSNNELRFLFNKLSKEE